MDQFSKNRYIKAGVDTVNKEFNNQVAENFDAVIDGRKKFSQAAGDIVVNTATNSIVTYGKEHGEEIAEKAFKSLAKEVEKRVGKNILSNTLKSNSVITTAGAIYDVYDSFDKLMKGEITGTEFLNKFVDKGVDIVIQNAATMAGTAIGAFVGGPVGAVVGNIAGAIINYFASGFLNGVVNRIRYFRMEAKAARQRYEFIHAFCEHSIAMMKAQREEFERDVAQFLSNRQQVIDRSLNNYETALKYNDFDSMNDALNDIAEEFGGELTFKTFDEFDRFMRS